MVFKILKLIIFKIFKRRIDYFKCKVLAYICVNYYIFLYMVAKTLLLILIFGRLFSVYHATLEKSAEMYALYGTVHVIVVCNTGAI
jgi:hypothetical protein